MTAYSKVGNRTAFQMWLHLRIQIILKTNRFGYYSTRSRKSRTAQRVEQSFGVRHYDFPIPAVTPKRAELQVLRDHHAEVTAYVQHETIFYRNSGLLHQARQRVHAHFDVPFTWQIQS